MSLFKFNFGKTQDPVNENISDNQQKVNWFECEVVHPDTKQINEIDNTVLQAKMFTCGDVEIGHVVASNAVACINKNVHNNSIELAENEHSDLIAGKYEGGLKIWECTSDLIKYLEENKEYIELKDKNVLDLGCGAGILGIYSFINKSKHITFQDYNKEVLEYVTIPNVLLNIEEERENEIKKCSFYSGDWGSFAKKLSSNIKYDVILTSETIYNKENYDKLIDIFTNRLSDNGTVWIAAKSYYFGVGGSVKEFECCIKNTGCLKIDNCWKSISGINREIIKLSKY